MDEIIRLLNKEGALTGRELCDKSEMDELSLWCICTKSKKIITKIFGKRFLRLDKRVEGYARLSPSIKREFLTYTVIGLKKDIQGINLKAEALRKKIIDISKKKFELTREVIRKLVELQKESETIKKCACFIVAGDIVYEMAHSDPRPELSTGELVKGSDLDIIVVAENLPENTMKNLDYSIYKEKYHLIKDPKYREEIDYIVKDISKVKAQLQFDSFKSMVASKILYEGKFFYGEHRIFKKIKRMLLEKKIPEKLQIIEKKAIINRKSAKSYLLDGTGALSEEECVKLFYTKEESEEIF